MQPIATSNPQRVHCRDDDVRVPSPTAADHWPLPSAQVERLGQLAIDGRWPLTPSECSALQEVERLTHQYAKDLQGSGCATQNLELGASSVAALRTFADWVPEGLLPLNKLAPFRDLARSPDLGQTITLGHWDILELTEVLNLVRDRRGTLEEAQDLRHRQALRQHARLAQWVHAAPDREMAGCREQVVDDIRVAWDRSKNPPGASIDLSLKRINSGGGLPPQWFITERLRNAGTLLTLHQDGPRPTSPAQFKASAAHLRITALRCTLDRNKLPEGLDISTLERIEVVDAPGGALDTGPLFVQLRTMPGLRSVTLPPGAEPTGFPLNWTFCEHSRRLEPDANPEIARCWHGG